MECSKREFYSVLHQYLKVWPTSRLCTNTTIGSFYTMIDPSLKERNFRPDNAHRYVDRLVKCYLPLAIDAKNELSERTLSSIDNDVDQCNLEEQCESPHFHDCPPMIATTCTSPVSLSTGLTTTISSTQCRLEAIESTSTSTPVAEPSHNSLPHYVPRNVDRREK